MENIEILRNTIKANKSVIARKVKAHSEKNNTLAGAFKWKVTGFTGVSIPVEYDLESGLIWACDTKQTAIIIKVKRV